MLMSFWPFVKKPAVTVQRNAACMTMNIVNVVPKHVEDVNRPAMNIMERLNYLKKDLSIYKMQMLIL